MCRYRCKVIQIRAAAYDENRNGHVITASSHDNNDSSNGHVHIGSHAEYDRLNHHRDNTNTSRASYESLP